MPDQNPSKLQNFYTTLVNKGLIDKPYNEFADAMSDERRRQKLYDGLTSRGIKVSPSPDVFHSTITNWIEQDRMGEKQATRDAIGQTRQEIAAAENQIKGNLDKYRQEGEIGGDYTPQQPGLDASGNWSLQEKEPDTPALTGIPAATIQQPLNTLGTARKELDRAETTLNATEKKDVHGVGGAAKAFGQGLTSMEVEQYVPYLAGFSEAAHQQELASLSSKIEKGESLSLGESLLAKSAGLNTQAQSVSDVSNWYSGGQTVGAMVPFMGEMAATAGVGGAAAKMVQAGLKARNVLLGTNIASKIARGTLSSLSYATAQTPFQSMLYSEYQKNKAGQYSLSVNPETGAIAGELIPGSVQSDPKAAYNAFTSTLMETWSEGIGEYGPKFMKTMLGKAGTSAGAKLLTTTFRKAAKFDGPAWEIGEEYFNALGTAALQGDTEQLEQMFTKDGFIQTVIPVAVVSGAFKALEAGEKTVVRLNLRSNNAKTSKEVENQVNDPAIRQTIKQAADLMMTDPEQSQAMLNGIGSSLNPVQKAAVIRYMAARLQSDIFNRMNEEDKANHLQQSVAQAVGQSRMMRHSDGNYYQVTDKLGTPFYAIGGDMNRTPSIDNPIVVVDGEGNRKMITEPVTVARKMTSEQHDAYLYNNIAGAQQQQEAELEQVDAEAEQQALVESQIQDEAAKRKVIPGNSVIYEGQRATVKSIGLQGAALEDEEGNLIVVQPQDIKRIQPDKEANRRRAIEIIEDKFGVTIYENIDTGNGNPTVDIIPDPNITDPDMQLLNTQKVEELLAQEGIKVRNSVVNHAQAEPAAPAAQAAQAEPALPEELPPPPANMVNMGDGAMKPIEPAQAQAQGQAPNVQKPSFPTNKQGEIQYEQISDPAMFAQALTQEFGEEAGAVADELLAEQTKLLKKAQANTNPIDRRRKMKVVQAQIDKLTTAKKLIANEQQPDPRPSQPVNQDVQPVAGTPEAGAVAPEAGAEPEKRSFTDLTEEQKKRPKRRTGAQRKVEDMEFDGDPVGFAMQFMSNMGDLHMSAIEELFTIHKGRETFVSPGELAARVFWVNRKGGGMTIDQIAHHLWESQPEGMDVPDDEYRNIVADIIIGHKTPAGIARALIERGVKAVGKGENMEQNDDFANFLAQEERRQEALFDEVFVLALQEVERTGKLITDEEYLSLFLQDDTYYEEGTGTNGIDGASGQDVGDDGNEQGGSSRNDEGAPDPQAENGNEAEADNGAGNEDGSGIAPQPVFEIGGQWFNFAQHTPGEWWLYQYYEDRWQPIPNTADEIRGQEIASQYLAKLPEGSELVPPFETDQAEKQPKSNTVIDHITADEINDQAAQADPNPSDAQKEAGNYKHGHTNVQGFDISIENAAGSIRSGRDSDGEEWMVEMQNHYGYFTRTEGKDGDQVDCFIGDNPVTGKIFIVDQINPDTGEFDEHKVMIGFNNIEEATDAYYSNYSHGWKGLGAITEMPHDEFKTWLKDGTRTKEPVAYVMPSAKQGSENGDVDNAEKPNNENIAEREAKQREERREQLNAEIETMKAKVARKQSEHDRLKKAYDEAKNSKQVAIPIEGTNAGKLQALVFDDQADVEKEAAQKLRAVQREIDGMNQQIKSLQEQHDALDIDGKLGAQAGLFSPQEAQQPASDALPKENKENEKEQKESKKIVVIPNGTTAFDKQAQTFIQKFLDKIKASERVKFSKGKSTYDMFAVMNDKGEIVALTDSPAKAYAAALNTDNESLHIVRETRTEEAVTYDYYTGSLFGDYNENDLYDEAGSLKQEVKDAVIKEIEQAFKIESKADISPSNSPEKPDGSKETPQQPVIRKQTERPADYGKKNVVVKEDAKNAALERLRKKRGNLNTGIDPQDFMDGVTVACYHLEAGLRKFSEWGVAMLEDVGEWARPYLKSWYNAIRDYPGMEQYESEMTPYDQVKSFDLTTIQKSTTFDEEPLKKEEDVSDRSGDSEQDRKDGADEVPHDDNNVHGDGGTGRRDGSKDQSRRGKGNGGRSGGKGGSGLFTSIFGESSDNEVHSPDKEPIPPVDNAGDFDGRGNGVDGSTGYDVSDEETNDTDSEIGGGVSQSFKQRLDAAIKKQREVEGTPVVLMDKANIRETLPVLLPEQQDDVAKAEERFFAEKHQTKQLAFGKGMLFTNGTGTGKTFTGLGIIKRFVKSGKKNILIVVPSEAKINDWIKEGAYLGLDVTAIQNLKDKGVGVRVTTYAMFQASEGLPQEDFDLVVFDESHRIMDNNKGEASGTTKAFQGAANVSESDAYARITSVHPVWVEHRELFEQYTQANKNFNSNLDLMDWQVEERRAEIKKLDEKLKVLESEKEKLKPALKERAKKAYENTKVVLLSATPFKSVFNLRYANGVLFDWGNETTYEQASRGSSRVHPEGRFFLDHFGAMFEWKYHKLQSKSKANAEAIAMQEVEFANKLIRDGVMSGRAIESNMDYSREFPVVALGGADKINEAFAAIFNYSDGAKYDRLREAARAVFFSYEYATQLFESLRAEMMLPRIEKHLAMGRKVVVFHRRRQSKATAPFATVLNEASASAKAVLSESKDGRITYSKEEIQKAHDVLAQVEAFKSEYAELLAYEQTLSYASAVDQLQAKFGDQVVTLNGTTKNSDKPKVIEAFNNDDSGKNIIVIQEEAGKEGISLHDKTGKHQRVLVSLSIPISSTTALQVEGRIYRIGQETDAIFEYPMLGLDMEIMAFGQKVNKKLSTTENLAVGDKSRDLLRSFAEGVLFNATKNDPSENQGKGGKEADKREQQSVSLFQKAVLVYHSNQKKRGRRDEREGVDYYATPEPVGQKMVEWLDLGPADSVLEPSAGHGAISMWFPEDSNATVIEPSYKLFSKLGVRTTAGNTKLLNSTFESLNVVNKYDGIVMNPPFGSGGALAAEHVAKAFSHLKTGGRIVALIPVGSMDKRMDKFFEENPSAKLVAEIKMPSVTFEQAGTAVNTRIVVIDKTELKTKSEIKAEVYDRAITDPYLQTKEQVDAEVTRLFNQQAADNIGYVERHNISSAKTIDELFDNIEGISIPDRTRAEVAAEPGSETAETKQTEDYKAETVKHTKTGEAMHIVKMVKRLTRDEYVSVAKKADKYGGYYNKFLGAFHFKGDKAIENRAKFIDEVFGETTPDAPRFSIERTPAKPFYSPTEKAIQAIRQEKGTAAQFKAMLLKNGAKQAEMDWMGWDDHFPEAGKMITKADVQQWIDQNKIEVEEVVKGEYDDKTNFDRLISDLEADKNDLEDEIRNDIKNNGSAAKEKTDRLFEIEQQITDLEDRRYSNNQNASTKYSQYQEPGGENYREVLLVMPEKVNPVTKITELPSDYEFIKDGDKWGVIPVDQVHARPFSGLHETKEEARQSAIDKINRLSKQDAEDKAHNSQFKGDHFDEPNILAHIRLNERTDADGNKVLFVEEIQSDWAQKGRKEGFKGKLLNTNLSYIDYRTKLWEKYNVESVEALSNKASADEMTTLSALWDKESNTSGKISSGVPDMPFKQTDQWVNLALRRMMRYAAENGFDRIAWTTGEQQAARYDLSKQIDEIEVEQGGKYKSWKYRLIINYNSGQKTSKLIDNDQELEDNVGKELAKKIIDDIAQGKSNFPAHGSNVYSGLDLKVGGEGMEAFYDAIIPAQANKVGKPFGASVEKTTLPDVGTVNSIPVTERMKEGAKAGFPLFSLERTPTDHPTIHDAKIEALRDLSEKAQNARPTFVSGTYEDLMAQMGANNEPAAFIKAVLEQIAMGNKIQAFMGQHGVYFVAKNINDASQARKLWIHEQGTHVGLRLLFKDAKALDTFLNKVFNMLGEDAIMEAFDGALQPYVQRDKAGNITNKAELAEEYMARLSEKVVDGTDLSAKEKTIWAWLRDRLMNLIRKFANDEIKFNTQAEADRFLSEIIRQSVREVVGSKPNPQTTNVPYSAAQPNKARTVGEYLTDPKFSLGAKSKKEREDSKTPYQKGSYDPANRNGLPEGVSFASEPTLVDINGQTKLWEERDYTPGDSNRLADEVFSERFIDELKGVNFQGSPITGFLKVKNSAEVAYLFKNLEKAATENAFAVLIKPNGGYQVLWLSHGSTSGTILDIKLALAAAKDFGANRVTFVHNHPSGNLTKSDADVAVYRKLRDALKVNNISLMPGIVINLDSGEYLEFTDDDSDLIDTIKEPTKKTRNVKVFGFDRQELYRPSSERTKIRSSRDVAAYLSKAKRGTTPKIGALILNRGNEVMKAMLFDETISTNELTQKLMYEVAKHGDTVILHSNTKINPADVRKINAAMKTIDSTVLDVIQSEQDKDVIDAYKSFADEGLLEPQAEYISSSPTKLPKTIEVDGKQRPTTNSNGQPIHSTEEGVRNFYRWFGESKVVDGEGRPLVVYHGAPDARFVNEDGTFKNHDQRWGRDEGLSQHWFAKDRNVARTYADDRRAFDYQAAVPGIIDTYIKLENPLIIDGEFKNWRDAQAHGKTKTVVDKAREEGRDGVIIKNVKDNYNNNVSSKATDTYAVFSNTQIKSATANDGTFDGQNPDIRFAILGEMGAANLDKAQEATTRMDNLTVAREMESADKDAKAIRLATGWERGKDGLWRYEVPDGKLITSEFIREKRPIRGAESLLYRGVESQLPYTDESPFDKLENIWNDVELYKAYPQIRNIRVFAEINSEFPSGNGSYSGKDKGNYGNGFIKAYAPSNDALKSILLHEIQHAIQEIEGFARGGTPDQFTKARDNIKRLFKDIENVFDKLGYEEWLLNGGVVDNSISRNFNGMYSFAESQSKTTKDRMVKKLDEANQVINENRSIFGKYNIYENIKDSDLYSRLSGEVEARNVQSRLNFTDQQRRETLLAETEDVAREDQIILMGAVGGEKAEKENIRFSIAPDMADHEIDNDWVASNNTNRIIKRQLFQDNMIIGQRLIDEFKARGGKTNELTDFVSEHNKQNSRSMFEIRQYDEKYFKPMLEAIAAVVKKHDLTVTELNDYLLAKHSIERHDAGVSALSEEPGTEWSREYVQSLVDAFEAKVPEAEREQMYATIRKATMYSIEKLYSTGTMLPETYERIRDQYQYYVPLRDWAKPEEDKYPDEIFGYTNPSSRYTKHNSPLKTAKGRMSKSEDPLGFIQSLAHSAITFGNKNEVRRTALRLLQANKDEHQTWPLAWQKKVWYVREPGGVWEETLEKPSAEKIAASKEAKAEYKRLARKLKRAEKNGEETDVLETIAAEMEMVGENITVESRVLAPHAARKPYHLGVQHEVEVFDNGVKHVMVFADPRIAEALNGMDMYWNVSAFGKKLFSLEQGTASVLSRAIGRPTRWLTQNFTAKNPAFIPVNWIRDYSYAITSHLIRDANYGLVEMGLNPDTQEARQEKGNIAGFIRNTPVASRAIHRYQQRTWNPVEDEMEQMTLADKAGRNAFIAKYGKKRYEDTMYMIWMKGGGETGYVHMKTPDQLKLDAINDLNKLLGKRTKGDYSKGKAKAVATDVKSSIEMIGEKAYINAVLKHSGHALNYLANMSENMSRFATFMASMEDGKTFGQATMDSKNITTNFNRRGRATAFIAPLYGFVNANIQGGHNLLHLAKHNGGIFFAVAATFMISGALAAEMVMALMSGDDDEKGIPDYILLNNIVIPTGEGKYISIPVMPGFRMFWAAGVLAAQGINGKKSMGDVIFKTTNSIAESFSPFTLNESEWEKGQFPARAFIPTAMVPAYDIATNSDFTGKPIERKRWNEYTPDSELGMRRTSEAFKTLATTMNKLAGGDETRSAIYSIREDGSIEKAKGVEAAVKNMADFNPSVMEHVLLYYAGGRGRFFNDVRVSVGKLLQGEAPETYQIPVIKRLYGSAWDYETSDKWFEYGDFVAGNKLFRKKAEAAENYELADKLTGSEKTNELIDVYDYYKKEMDDLEDEIDAETDEKAKKELLKERATLMGEAVKEMDAINDKYKK